jgi:hypothetical protein
LDYCLKGGTITEPSHFKASYLFILVGLEFELRASHLQSRSSTTLATPPLKSFSAEEVEIECLEMHFKKEAMTKMYI